MGRKQLIVWCGAIVLILGSTAVAGQVGLVGYWQLDEGQGTTASDSSGNGLDGTLGGSPIWIEGMVGGALSFNGSSDYVEVPNNSLLDLTTGITIAAWTYMNPGASGEMAILSKGGWAANNLPYELTEENGGVIFWQFYNDAGRDSCSPSSPSAGEWHHLAATYDGSIFKCYIDGVLADEWAYSGTMPINTASVTIGRRSTGGCFYNGMIDDVQLWQRALSETEVLGIMPGLVSASLAQDPSPEDAATDVPYDVVLGWSAGETAATHDVYLGTSFADVNDAGRGDARDVLISQDQDATEYDTEASLEFGQTYYWRIDEVNAAPDYTIFKGGVWSFTTEPYAYPITSLTVEASAEQATSPAIRTIDGSGLDDLDQHGIDLKDMWMTPGGLPASIEYTFDGEYKLYELWVWNGNSELELFMGFGAKEVAVEYSTDGETWAALADVPEFGQGTGTATYMANTVVSFGGVSAKYVRLTINATYGATGIACLSEVRFFYIPFQAFRPDPADGATDVSVETSLNWRPGREATSHAVYVDADQAAVADGTAAADTVTDHSYTPSALNFATQYSWRVDEGDYAGEVWSFTTEEFAAIDDFENYDDDIDAETTLWQTWVDGLTNNTGSYVGYENSKNGTFCETSIVHDGWQSMPVTYDNTGSPYYSEVERAFDASQDWTAHGADTLCLYFRGVADNSAEGLYVIVKDSSKSATVAHSDAAATTAAEWQQWTIPLSEFTSAGVKVTAVKGLAIGVGNRTSPTAGGTGIVYFDDIGYGCLLQ